MFKLPSTKGATKLVNTLYHASYSDELISSLFTTREKVIGVLPLNKDLQNLYLPLARWKIT